MIKREIEIDGKQVLFKASAYTPIFYRALYGRDMFKDMSRLEKVAGENSEDKSRMQIEDVSMFENIAYCMAKQAEPNIPGLETWFDQFNVFSIYTVLPEIIEMWKVNQITDVENKKKLKEVQGR